MGIDQIKTICVVGSGTMGAQIAQQSALRGFDVWLTDVSEEQLQGAVESNRKLLGRRVEKGQMSQADADAAVARVRTTTSLDEAAGACDFVFEAIVEKLEPKRAVFAALDAIARARTIPATNSSTIPIAKPAHANSPPDPQVHPH